MSFASYWRRLKEMPWEDRLLLVETVGTLAVASFSIRMLPFRKVMAALTARPVESGCTVSAARAISRVRWAIEACGRVLPWKIVCFQKGLTMQWMLQRRQIASRLHYGVSQDDERGLRAHVWVTYRGEGIMGAEQAAGYTCLATFPADASRPVLNKRRHAQGMPNAE